MITTRLDRLSAVEDNIFLIFTSLSASRQFLTPFLALIIAAVNLVAFDYILARFGFAKVYRLVRRWPCLLKLPLRSLSYEDIVTIQLRVQRYYFRPVACLLEAASLACLLRLFGHQSVVVLGILPRPFKAHAWVDLNGVMLPTFEKRLQFYKIVERLEVPAMFNR